ncbi:MAG TPA: hypothetical protein VHZ56_07815 [Devosia sp.]|nr:hypothetical protein [Devosia sp.]
MRETRFSPVAGTSLYTLAVVLAAFELFVAWQAFHPNVSATYRSYYIDETTTCLDQPVAGTYRFGTTVSFRSGNEPAIKPIRVCGWEGPAGDGLHSVGESSRLRFALPAGADKLSLTVELVAVDFAKGGAQPVDIVVNGRTLARLDVHAGTPQSFTLDVPDALLQPGKPLDVELQYPEAIRVGADDPNTRKRSIKLTEARVNSSDPALLDLERQETKGLA